MDQLLIAVTHFYLIQCQECYLIVARLKMDIRKNLLRVRKEKTISCAIPRQSMSRVAFEILRFLASNFIITPDSCLVYFYITKMYNKMFLYK